jgi:hypothetical protein
MAAMYASGWPLLLPGLALKAHGPNDVLSLPDKEPGGGTGLLRLGGFGCRHDCGDGCDAEPWQGLTLQSRPTAAHGRRSRVSVRLTACMHCWPLATAYGA